MVWPWQENGPKHGGENFKRAHGKKDVASAPILPQSGNIWDDHPESVPSLMDVDNPNSEFNRNYGKTTKHLDTELNKIFPENQLPVGGKIALGEDEDMRLGNREDPLPDAASKYIEGPNTHVVAIPNGDGTVTMVAPDGSVRVISEKEFLDTSPPGSEIGPAKKKAPKVSGKKQKRKTK
ncbi:hypothetical protein RF55_16117 [Lasius niger]|uniref:Uncharacterized protein n=1 Tax=Lasius niger TaxID=67767 RepID=A0A0J7MY80_LASNI|nr:hypothetical protein RF55_16117 [Lasius niger]